MINHGYMAWLYISLLALVLQLFLPWWSISIAAITIGLWLGQKGLTAFFSGFIGVGLLWLIAAAFINMGNEGILAERVSAMMGLPGPVYLILITGLLGGLVGGISSLTGYLLKDSFLQSQGRKG